MLSLANKVNPLYGILDYVEAHDIHTSEDSQVCETCQLHSGVWN